MNNDKTFDENDAIEFIRNYVPTNIKDKYSDNDIILLIDTMFDYYDENEDDDELYNEGIVNDEVYINRIVNYVKKAIRKDPDNAIEMDDVKHLVLGEIEYESTLDII